MRNLIYDNLMSNLYRSAEVVVRWVKGRFGMQYTTTGMTAIESSAAIEYKSQ